MKEQELTKTFGVRLRKLRTDKGWSQQRLADEADLGKQTIQRIEWGQLSPTLNTLSRISNAMEITLSELLISIETFDK